MAGWFPGSPTAIGGALESKTFDNVRIGPVRADNPYGALVGRYRATQDRVLPKEVCAQSEYDWNNTFHFVTLEWGR